MKVRLSTAALAAALGCVVTTPVLAQSSTATASASADVLRTKTGKFAEAAGGAEPRAAAARPATATAPAKPSAEPVLPLLTFELRATDGTVKNAFLRWAEEAKIQVNWQLQSELPLDAVGPVTGVSVPDAMTNVAKAFVDKPQPFVIREYDNTTVVLPRLLARP